MRTEIMNSLTKLIREVMVIENTPVSIVSRVNVILDAIEGKDGKDGIVCGNELIEFIKKNVDNRREKVGVLYATVDKDNVVRIGWSKTNTKMKDVFDKEYGLNLAKERAWSEENMKIPAFMRKKIRLFKTRCSRYFQGATIPLSQFS